MCFKNSWLGGLRGVLVGSFFCIISVSDTSWHYCQIFEFSTKSVEVIFYDLVSVPGIG